MFARITFLLMVCISMLVLDESGGAQTYPNGKPIKLVSGAAPGSATDIVGRAVGETFRSQLGVPVIFENRTGAAGVIAARTTLSAPPDGHTILVQTGSHTIAPFVVTVDYDPLRDFSGVAPLASVPNVLVVAHPQTPKPCRISSRRRKLSLGTSILDQWVPAAPRS
jgi:tripartite-type tricarboxylate transporter receptor subunit TctC